MEVLPSGRRVITREHAEHKKILMVLLVSGLLSLGCPGDTYQACSGNIVDLNLS